jgi:hypothetical protein
MCGAVRFEAKGEPSDVAYCHCTDCRGFTGAPVVTWVVFMAQDVQFTQGTRKTFESSPEINWGFCDKCGSSLTWEANSKRYDGKPIFEFHIGTFDDPSSFVPDRHWMEFERLPWFDVADNLPRYEKLDIGVTLSHSGPKKQKF